VTAPFDPTEAQRSLMDLVIGMATRARADDVRGAMDVLRVIDNMPSAPLLFSMTLIGAGHLVGSGIWLRTEKQARNQGVTLERDRLELAFEFDDDRPDSPAGDWALRLLTHAINEELDAAYEQLGEPCPECDVQHGGTPRPPRACQQRALLYTAAYCHYVGKAAQLIDDETWAEVLATFGSPTPHGGRQQWRLN
jgi:hypothetical protein